MSQVVLDTNVLASGFVRSNPGAAPAQLLDAWREGRFGLVVSGHILLELAHTLAQPYFRQRMTPGQIAGDRLDIHGVATHPEDDVVLATAVSARADYLVTGDTQLQQLGRYEHVQIVSPRSFLDFLQSESAGRG